MKKIISFIAAIVAFSAALNAQILNPVHWSFEAKKISDTEYDLIATAKLDKGWNIYTQFIVGDGPTPTVLTFKPTPQYQLVGKAAEVSDHKKSGFDKLFDMNVTKFSEEVKFVQRVKVTGATDIKGSVEFGTCDDEKCLPPNDAAFSYKIAAPPTAAGNGGASVTPPNVAPANPNGNPTTNPNGTPAVTPQYPQAKTPQIPQNQQVATVSDSAKTIVSPTTVGATSEAKILTEPSLFTFDKTNETVDCTTKGTRNDDTKSSLWWIFVLGFGGGLLALLTPCVFPMIPLTVSFFTKGSKDRRTGIRNALIYAASIVVMYVSMGLLITAVFGSDALNRLATNPTMNIAFGVLFLVFAVSFFGYFEITLPSSWTNKADAASDKGGLVGIFFMAFTLALVSFSCTGPIIGTLLVQTATTSGFAWGPAVGMLGFSTALALPFGLFALFPAWLQSLPKSGSWMDDVKVTLGFVEIALAFKFLSNADLIKGWKLIPYEVFLGIWILSALGLAAYHAGILRFKKGGQPKKLTLVRGAIVAAALGFAFYLGLGYRYDAAGETFKTPELGSGLLPPAGYSYIYPQKCPLNINCFHDLNEGLAYARKVNKPILLDFTGWNCANCRKMEENVWNKTGVRELIRDEYVLISLYTDDKSELKTPYAPYTSKFDQKLKDTEGEMWTDLQATFFNKNSQPYYVLLTPDLKLLNAPTAYTPEVEKYRAFLKCGIDKFGETRRVGQN